MRNSAAILAATLVCTLGIAVPASAQGVETGTDTIRVYAESPPACVVGQVRASSSANAVFVSDSAGGTVRITQLVDPQTAEPQAAGVTLAVPAVCNSAHRLIIESSEGGLQRLGGQPRLVGSATSFGDYLPYQMVVDWADRTVTRSSADDISSTAQTAASGDVNIAIDIAPGGGVLTAGTYSDNILIRFEPAS